MAFINFFFLLLKIFEKVEKTGIISTKFSFRCTLSVILGLLQNFQKLTNGQFFKFECCSHFSIPGPFTRENKKSNKVNLIGTISQNTQQALPSIVVEMCRVCFEFHRHSSHGTIKYVFIRMHKNRASCLHTMFQKKETLPKSPVQNYWHLLLGSNQGITLSPTVYRGAFGPKIQQPST